MWRGSWLSRESGVRSSALSGNAAYIHVFVPVEVLIWIRSVAIVLLIVAHALRHVSATKTEEPASIQPAQPASLVFTPELLSELRMLLTQTTVSEERQEPPQITETATGTATFEQVTEEQTTPDTPSFPNVPDEDRNKVIEAHLKGIPRREICAYLK